MKNLCTTFFLLFVALGSSWGQSNFDTAFSVVEKTNQEVLIKAKVINTHYTGSQNGGLVYINLERAYPNNPITVIISKEYRQNFPLMPSIEGKEVVISGFLRKHKNNGKPVLFLKNKKQLSIPSETGVVMR